MSGRSLSPGRDGSPGRSYRSRRVEKQHDSVKQHLDREVTNNKLADVFEVVKSLRDEKAELILQLETMMKTNHLDGERYKTDLAKTRADSEQIADMLRMCSDGIDQKSTAHIPELPEAAMAKVVPQGLRSMLDSSREAPNKISPDLTTEVSETGGVLDDIAHEYVHVAEASKCLLWDVERLKMIIQAYEQDLAQLMKDGNAIKAECNYNRIKWRVKYAGWRRWQDAVRRAHVIRYQAQLDEAIDALDAEQKSGEEELNGLLEMIGQTRIRDNKAKLSLFMKKMKNSKLYVIWRGWSTFHKRKQEERFADELERLKRMEAEKLAKMKNAETAAMLKCFIKRWQNMKLAVPFSTWSDICKDKREARRLAELEAERRRLFEQMQLLADGEMMQRLKLHFARLTGKTLGLTFMALRKHRDQARISRMGDDERFKRLKAVLEQKLKGLKFAIFQGLKRERALQKAMRIRNSAMGQKVAAFLEMRLKGVNFAIMSALKRNAAAERAERAEQERLAALIAASDNEALHRLKVYLRGKELRRKYEGFRWWKKCTSGSGLGALERELQAKRRARMELEERLAAAEAQLAGGSPEELERKIRDLERQLAAARAKTDMLTSEVASAKERLKDAEGHLNAEREGRAGDKQRRTDLQEAIQRALQEKDLLEKEIALIITQIGALSNECAIDERRR
eukprot:TRINITY_DN5064_c0_g1_i9.p1 TRINITY_DN5064_c0_g1~~TRINITY_DN5064_c0_g1_i9.p1  ORF type:complete len:682 (+),score=249.92 TRINITY_DN5064_c0_g1_i9:213-2258(+)